MSPDSIHNFLPQAILLGTAIYFLFFRPQQRKNSTINNLKNQLTIGTEIETTSGIIGKIVGISPNHLILEINPGQTIFINAKTIKNILPKDSMLAIAMAKPQLQDQL